MSLIGMGDQVLYTKDWEMYGLMTVVGWPRRGWVIVELEDGAREEFQREELQSLKDVARAIKRRVA